MGLESRLTDDLIRIAAAGGGFRLQAGSRLTDDLTRIAAAAGDSDDVRWIMEAKHNAR